MVENLENPLQIVKEKFAGDQFASMMGIVLDDLTDNSVHMHMKLDERMNNLFDRPHGGAIYALADAAFSVLGNNKNNISVAIECSISYHESPEPGSVLHVDGKIVSQSRRIGTYLFTLYTSNGDSRKLIATMKSTLYRTGRPIVPEGTDQAK